MWILIFRLLSVGIPPADLFDDFIRNWVDRLPTAHMGQMQNMIHFPPAPELDP